MKIILMGSDGKGINLNIVTTTFKERKNIAELILKGEDFIIQLTGKLFIVPKEIKES